MHARDPRLLRADEGRFGGSPFGRLAMGGSLGKSSILIYDPCVGGEQPAEVDMLSIEGDDLDAGQLVVTLHPPRVVPIAREDIPINYQTSPSATQSNSEVEITPFPGDRAPIKWPPLEAAIEFGVGGVSSKVVVDYINGVTLSVTASFLRVHATVTQSDQCNGISGTAAAYHLAAHVGPGYCSARAQRTIFVGTVCDDEESCVFPVPRFSHVATLIGCGHECGEHCVERPKCTKGWIRYWQSPDGTNCVGDLYVSDQHQRIEIPNAAQYFSVVNDTDHKMKMAVIFDLAL
jgi:hypothetical protein